MNLLGQRLLLLTENCKDVYERGDVVVKKFAVHVNEEKKGAFEIAQSLREYALKNGCTVVFAKDECPEDANAIISIGGDGTFLSAARLAYPKDVPVIGINLGTLGFLTEIEPEDIENKMQMIIDDDFKIENRMALDILVNISGDKPIQNFALNDAVISKLSLSKILHLGLSINQQFIDLVSGDGIIVASPTGSTAYSMSAGGPIVEPDLNLLLITPICPHTLFSRPFITDKDSVVKVQVDYSSENAITTIDGNDGYKLVEGDFVEVSKAQKMLKLIRLQDRNFYDVLRWKIFKRGGVTQWL